MISYDRKYDASNLATEMINGERNDYTLLTAMQHIGTQHKNKLGNIYVKYLDPVNMGGFMRDNCSNGVLNQEDFDKVSLDLNNLLMERQQRETPITLNSLLSSWLL